MKLNTQLKFFALFSIMTLHGCATLNGERGEDKIKRAEGYLDMANASLLEGDPTGALQQALEAERLNPESPHVQHTMALAYYSKHDLVSAIRSAQRAVELDSNFSIAENTLGNLLMQQGKYDQAKPHLQKAAKDSINRESYKAKINLGILKYKVKQFSESKIYFKEAVRDAPDHACIARYYLGHLALKENEPRRALENYRGATKGFCGGQFVNAHYAVGTTLLRVKNFSDARKKFLEIQELYPDTRIANKALLKLRELP